MPSPPPPDDDRIAEIERALALLARVEAAMDRFPHARDVAELAVLAGLTEEEAEEARRLLPSLREERGRRPDA